LLTYLRKYWENNAWVNADRKTNTYDASGNRLTWLYERWLNNAWVNYYRYTYTYDTGGNMLTYLWEACRDNIWVNSERRTWTYDVSGNMLTYLWEDWQDNALVNSYRYTYTYDYNGNATEGFYEVWKNESWSAAEGSIDMLYNNKKEGYSSWKCHKITIQYTTVTDIKDESPSGFSYTLEQNYPNPFNPETRINYNLAKSGNVRLSIYDITGRRVATLIDARQEAGRHTVKLLADKFGLASGVYFYELRANDFRNVKKLLLLK
jgi:hypothetical protein